jgi:hypothetical protein
MVLYVVHGLVGWISTVVVFTHPITKLFLFQSSGNFQYLQLLDILQDFLNGLLIDGHGPFTSGGYYGSKLVDTEWNVIDEVESTGR